MTKHPTKKQSSNRISHLISKLSSKGTLRSANAGLLIFIAAFSIIGTYLLFGAFAASSGGKGKVTGPSLSITPGSQKVAIGSTLTLAIWVDAMTESVNAVQANLVYPADKFVFISIDAAGSAFPIEAEAKGGEGSIKIARGATTSVTGRQYIATVRLQPKVSSGRATVNFAPDSALVRATDYTNILQNTVGGRYTLSE